MDGFSGWTRWQDRRSLPQRDGPGVYVLGRFESGPPQMTDPVDERVVLIAETHAQTLTQRWRQFDHCARRGEGGHAGGCAFWRLFGNGSDSEIPGWLCVAARPVPAATPDALTWIREVKAKLLSRYQERHGVLPACNSRGPGGTTGSAGIITAAAAAAAPSVAFSPWVPWRDRSRLLGLQSAGVYALARFDIEPSGEADLQDAKIVYIGETCDNSLHGRLYQFQRSAFAAKDGHSGGWTYREKFGGEGEDLFVSVFAVPGLSEPQRSTYIRFVERELLWRYVQRWGRRPLCNSK